MSLSELALVARRHSSAEQLHQVAESVGKIAVPVSSLTAEDLEDTTTTLPTYDRSRLGTGIVHFGVGGFHRSHQVRSSPSASIEDKIDCSRSLPLLGE